MNQGKYVFNQLTDFLPQRVLDRLVEKYNGNKYVKFFSCWNQLSCMLFGQLSGRESLRDLMIGLEAHKSKFYHLGFGKNVTRSNLAKANEKRNYRIFEEFAYHLINEARRVTVTRDFDLNIKSNVFAFDSSIIDLCLSVFWWAEFRKTKGGVKIHTLFDVKTSIRESKLEDFLGENGETIFVSTIHKANGKEFENVFIMLENCDLSSDEKKRPLYVAMTRAKQNLFIHHNSNFFDTLQANGLVSLVDHENYESPDKITMQLSFSDVNLGFYEYRQSQINRLVPGDILIIKDEGCTNNSGDIVLKFSKKFNETISQLKDQGYHLINARINFIL